MCEKISVTIHDESYALILYIISFCFLLFLENCYCIKKKKIIELFTELLWLPGMHPVYSCTEDYLAEAEEILKACALLCIFMYLSCGVYCVTLSGGGLFVPLQDVLSLASTFFFLSLFFFFFLSS